jgi:hypothetical protein
MQLNTFFVYMIFVAGARIFLFNLVQMLSLTFYAGKVLRKNLKKALPDLIHVIVIAIAISFIT